MKKVLSLICLIVLSAATTHAYREDVSMIPVMKKSLEIINLIEEQDNEIVRIEYDIVATKKESFRTLSSQYVYGIIAFGDDRIKDLDVRLYRKRGSSWELVAKDNDSNNVAAVTVSPDEPGEYKIEVSAYSFYKDYSVGHYGLIIYHE